MPLAADETAASAGEARSLRIGFEFQDSSYLWNGLRLQRDSQPAWQDQGVEDNLDSAMRREIAIEIITNPPERWWAGKSDDAAIHLAALRNDDAVKDVN